jgi:hypothetical protein
LSRGQATARSGLTDVVAAEGTRHDRLLLGRRALGRRLLKNPYRIGAL